MASLQSLLASKSTHLLSPSLRASNVPKRSLLLPQCSHQESDSAMLESCSLQLARSSHSVAGAGCVVGLGTMLAGTMLAFPEHANAAAAVDAWSSLVASEPKNALSLPTWVIHVASVVECRVPLPCRMLESVFGFGEVQSSVFRETELTNALSLPTWFIHVATVVEWTTAMALVWRYGDTPGNSTWKGLSWGMVPLLGGAMCACTWHFFYNAQSLEILVVFQAALTVIGNFTMWIAAFRIYQASQKQSKAP